MDPFKLKKPCANCPFNKVGAIELAEGRLDDIVQTLLSDDRQNFHCHKTVHHPKGGTWEETEDGQEKYVPSGHESLCAGASIYLLKLGRPSVSMRLGMAFKLLDFQALEEQYASVIEPDPKHLRIGHGFQRKSSRA